MVAHAINRLLKRAPPPSDPNEALPQPSPAAWDALQNCLDIAFSAQNFYQMEDNFVFDLLPPHQAFKAMWALQHLKLAVEELPYNLIAGHLPNLSLDVGALLR